MNIAALGPGDPAWPDDAVEVGHVAGAWGVQGWIKVQPYAADPQALFSTKRWFVRPPDAPAPRQNAMPALLKVMQAREHGDGVIAAVQEVSDRDAAQALRGARLFVARSSFPTAAPDEYYWIDLIGCVVSNREGLVLGRVEDLLDTGAHSVLQVVAEDATQRLIPFVAAYVDTVDVVAKRITVDWGLDY